MSELAKLRAVPDQLKPEDFTDPLLALSAGKLNSLSRIDIQSARIQGAAQLEHQALDLFYGVAAELSGLYQSNDSHFWPNRDAIGLDVHAFFENSTGHYFHLRAYVKHMLLHYQEAQSGIFLTAYLKDGVHVNGGKHALNQSWFPWDSKMISLKIIEENPQLLLRS